MTSEMLQKRDFCDLRRFFLLQNIVHPGVSGKCVPYLLVHMYRNLSGLQ